MATLRELADIVGAELIVFENSASHDGSAARDADDTVITSISLDSRTVEPTGLFAGVPGTHVHGASFSDELDVAAVITDREGVGYIRRTDRPVLIVDDVLAALGPISAAVYDHPSEKLTIIGITGTSGKTTTSYMVEQGLLGAGLSVGLIGTTGTRINREPVPSSLTTPQAPDLQALFARMVREGVTHVVMEVSSHAIALGRITGTCFAAVGFTNLSQDHLDFHPTMEDYFETKARLFTPGSPVAGEKAVICIDDRWGRSLAERTPGAHLVSSVETAASVDPALTQGHVVSFAGPSVIHDNGVQEVSVNVTGIEAPGGGRRGAQVGIGADYTLELAMPGRFNVSNALLAVELLASVGIDRATAVAHLAQVSVPGRLERIDAGQPFLVVVDYAHKPGALAAVIDTVSEHVRGRVGVVVGAGGDRDHSKRPIMGEVAMQRADLVVITDDNPRTEDPATIRQALVDGAAPVLAQRLAALAGAYPSEACSVAAEETDGAALTRNRLSRHGAGNSTVANSGDCPALENIGDRREAIRAAVTWAQPGDAVIIAGKGHETGQLIAGVTHPFDDREVAREELQRLLNSH